ncbi:MAG: hypothetical protein ACI37Z_04090 [Candidatus Gastranaerophilaceae bacterium]
MKGKNMQQGFAQNYKIRTSVLVFLKNSIAPLVLYFDNPKQEYEELLEIYKTQNNVAKIIEKETTGPIKKVAFMSNQISAVAIQEEPIMN